MCTRTKFPMFSCLWGSNPLACTNTWETCETPRKKTRYSWKKHEIHLKKWNSSKKNMKFKHEIHEEHEKNTQLMAVQGKKKLNSWKKRKIHAKKRALHGKRPNKCSHVCFPISRENSIAPYQSHRTYSWTYNRVFPSVYSLPLPSTFPFLAGLAWQVIRSQDIWRICKIPSRCMLISYQNRNTYFFKTLAIAHRKKWSTAASGNSWKITKEKIENFAVGWNL